MRDRLGVTHRLGHQLRLEAALHSDVPPGSLFNRLAHGKMSMVLENDRLLLTQAIGQSLAFVEVYDHSRVIIEQGMIAVEGTGILSQGIQKTSQARPGLP